MFNNFSRQKRNLFFMIKTKIFGSPKNRFFPKGLTHAVGQEMPIFSCLFSLKIRLETRFNNVLGRKKNFSLTIKTNFTKSQKMAFF